MMENSGTKVNIYWSNGEDDKADLYVNDKRIGSIDSEEDAYALTNNMDNMLEREFSAGFDRGILAGGAVVIATGIGMILLKLANGLTKRCGKF